MKKARYILMLPALLFILSSFTCYEVMPPPAGADFSPFLMTGSFCAPLDEAVLTDPFGWRFHPTDGSLDFHCGADLAAKEGTAVKAVMGGTVTAAGTHESYGNYVIIDHGSGFSTLYAHCSRLLVRKGERTTAGQCIGRVGQTGEATGPHLHFEIIRNGTRLDPLWMLGDGEKLTRLPLGKT